MILGESALIDVRQLPRGKTIAIIPVGSCEQHGPHLPYSTDALLADEFSRRAAEALGKEIPVIVLPSVNFGCSEEHMDFPFTMSLSVSTFSCLMEDLCRSLSRTGLRRIIIFNGHGGNMSALNAIVFELRRKTGAQVAVIDLWRLVEDAYSKIRDSKSKEIHAAEAETSLMMSLFNELVKTAVPEENERTRAKTLRHFELEGSGLSAFSWFTSDVSKSGVIGDASKATAEKGAHLLDASMKQLCQKVRAFAKAKP
jgi:creatinine amidohydrolase